MARKPRIEFDGAFYHIITRGNQRQKIFKKYDIPRKKIISFVFVVVFLFAAINSASAVRLDNPLGDRPLESVVSQGIDVVLGISGVLALIAFIYGGVLWMISSGSSSMIAKGKTVMVWSIVGLIVIFSSYAILSFVFEVLLGPTD